ncbi:non-ribosomal peptide synthetase [Paenibacillus daejeonensis]|uniref:non-ribosomal peptide synthetase n=1 Tax=Paenibacillus daejeonensis TaxID=135193 RepID=UPI00037868F1|nr:non-ribosomal peptide synthetase [Paenibacillus daejeonensis]
MNSNVEKIYPLTSMQEGMLYHKLIDDASTSYVVQNMIRLRGELDLGKVEQSLFLLTRKHAVLRTSFFYRKIKQPRQIVLKERALELFSFDISALPEQEQAEQLEQIKTDDLNKGFDLEKDPLMRVTVIKLAESDYKMLWSFHHIIMDGWCMSIIVRDFMSNYNNIQQGKRLEDLVRYTEDEARSIAKYEDYIKWLQTQSKERAMDYWSGLLEGYEQETGIEPLTPPSPSESQVEIANLEVSEETSEHLAKLASTLNVTVNTIVETAWGLLLQAYNGTTDAVFGKVVSGRNADLPGIEETVGLFINTVPVRVQCEEGDRLQDLIARMQVQALETGPFDYCSLTEIQEQTPLRGRLIRSLIAFENYYANYDEAHMDGVTIEVESLKEQTNYPLSLVVYLDDVLRMEMMYDPNAFEAQDIERILEQLTAILTNIAQSPEQKASAVSFISEAEAKLMVHRFNETKTAYPSDQTIHQLFEEQVRLTPDAEAAASPGMRMTYAELNHAANLVSSELQRQGVQAGQRIGIVSEKSVHMIAGILGILKSGCSYVPLHTGDPQSRVRYMLEDAAINTVLCGQASLAVVSELNLGEQLKVIELESAVTGQTANSEAVASRTAFPAQTGQASDAAYVMYTSGTTGQPKGVVVEHRNVVRLVKNTNYADFADARILQTGALSFDASTFEIWGALLNGGLLVLAESDTVSDGKQLERLIASERITMMWMTAQLFNHVTDTYPQAFAGLQHLLIGGEKLSAKHVHAVRTSLPQLKITNGYGPTENTTFSLTFAIDGDYDNIPVGKPISNSTAYILQGERLCGIGMAGELYVGGDGVARGYLNQPELTEQKFIANPFAPGSRLYRTGDLARWRPDGTIDYLGRIDAQVKIRGYRVEPGEIEQALRSQAALRDAAVIVREETAGDAYLCAYVVPVQTDSVNNPASDGRLPSDQHLQEQLRSGLRETLPDYMVPSSFVLMAKLPVTRNGKLDRRALPEPDHGSRGGKVAPRNETEAQLAQAFGEVLGLTEVGIHDSFFELGGHSLRAIRLVNQIESLTGTRLPLRAIFESPTVAGIGRLLTGEPETTYQPIPLAESKPFYAMSPAQKRLFVIHEMDPSSTVYNMPGMMEMAGEADLPRIAQAFQQLVDRHESLRTSFLMEEGEPVQRIHEHISVIVDYEDASGVEQSASDRLESFVQPFDVSTAPLIRLKVIHTGPSQNLLLFDMHHLISDGTTMAIITREFSQLYNGTALAPVKVHYKDYSEWMLTQDMNAHQSYWLNQFKGELPVLDLPLDYARPQLQSFNGAEVAWQLDAAAREAVQQLCRRTGATEYMVLLSTFMLLLGKYSRQEDIIVGSPVSGRMHQDTEQMVGMFVNTLALRGKPEPGKRYLSFLEEIKETSLKAFEHQTYPFEDLVEQVQVRRDMSRNPIFDVMLVLHNQEEEELTAQGLSFGEVEADLHAAKFDLTLNITATRTGYSMQWEYVRELFKPDTVERMATHFERLLLELASLPEKQLGEYELMTTQEQSQLLGQFNDTALPYPVDQTAHAQIEQQVRRTPERIALAYQDQTLSYAQLNERANQLARALRAKEVGNGDIVGIMVSRSLEMIVSILAVLKAGAAYLPIDPEYPADRIGYMLEDSATELLLTEPAIYDKLELAFDGQVVNVRDESSYDADDTSLDVMMTTLEPAYLIYTSGSTGKPKGVRIEHRSVSHLIAGMAQILPFEERESILNVTNISFDIFVVESIVALAKGLKIVITSEEDQKNPEAMRRLIETHEVDIVQTTPSRMKMLLSGVSDSAPFRSLKEVIVAGEALSEHLADTILEHISGKLLNMYGPTECTVYATVKEIRKGERVTIGKPTPNTTAYIVDAHQRLLPVGMKGELCIGGAGVAIGYLGRPELTAEKFVANPFAAGERMYRTGDLARWLPGGDIEYLGRLDEQVKIRGYRIELGEIESALRKQSGVRDAAVLAREDQAGDAYICAYVVMDEAAEPFDAARSRNELRQSLPEFMIPPFMVVLDRLPVTNNGKLDRRALPEPDRGGSSAYAAPRNETEAKLALVFQDVLGIPRVSIDDNFFELGGDSIKAIRIVSKAREQGLVLDNRSLFQQGDIRSLSGMLEQVQQDQWAAYQAEVEGPVRRTPIQQQFFDWQLAKPHHFNQAVMIRSEQPLQEELIRSALGQLVVHHDGLRTVFEADGSQRVRRTDEGEGFELAALHFGDVHDTATLAPLVEQHCLAIQQSMDLQQGPLVKAALFYMADGTHLFLCIHHLVVDGVSWRILLEDLSTLYTGLLSGEGAELPPKTASVQRWSEELAEYADSYLLKRELPYWSALLDEIGETTPPLSRDEHFLTKDGENKRQVGNEQMELSETLTNHLLYDSSHAYNTEINDLLLAAVQLAFRRSYGVDQIAVELESHGRHPIHTDIAIDRTVGWFTNMYPVLLKSQAGEDIGAVITQTKDGLRKIPNHGLGYSLLKDTAELKDRAERCSDQVQVSFNYLGSIDQDSGAFEFSGLGFGAMSAEENQMTRAMTIDGLIEGNQLKFTIGYDRSAFSQRAVQQFCTGFEQALTEVILHCAGKEDTQFTLSDYGDELEWDESELEGVLQLYDGGEEH